MVPARSGRGGGASWASFSWPQPQHRAGPEKLSRLIGSRRRGSRGGWAAAFVDPRGER
ncbi:MAG: hypothetical protein OZSIB_0111 [Candidatus Ozemobacter sibiricus]|uniref:Uncharacterized protein n=1 Tax=Candidatus Ozemobacter sibiricus TaxID=2268124 RepID=A0A367Z980_9BACT|nr:MAG: hypothetical protein OZSIB_0111 [Candidatus Ozemobacter sibiricus]